MHYAYKLPAMQLCEANMPSLLTDRTKPVSASNECDEVK